MRWSSWTLKDGRNTIRLRRLKKASHDPAILTSVVPRYVIP